MKTQNLVRSIRDALGLSAVALIVGMATGCEDGSSSKLGDGHNFGVNDPNVVAAMGDSITEGAPEFPSYTPILAGMIGKTVINFGAGGMKTDFGAATMNSVLASSKAGFVIILFGANDAINSYPLDGTMANFRYMIRAAVANNTIPIVCMPMPITGIRYIYNGDIDAINSLLPQIVKEEGGVLADLNSLFTGHPEYYYEGLHPNELGAQAIAQYLAGIFQ